MAGLAYYAPKPVLRGWKRFAYMLAVTSGTFSIGCWWDQQAQVRYSTFRGRTALYGSSTINPGWTHQQNQDKELL